jgi:sigma-B regulation protein RsbQ
MSALNPLKKNNVSVIGNQNAEKIIVFVHGFGTDKSAWDNITPAFIDNCRLVLLDNAGAGNSDPGAFVQHRYLNLHPYANDLLDICRELSLKDAILVGHSVGAMISALALIQEPDYFSKLILISASPRYLDTDGYRGGMTSTDLREIYKGIVESFDEWVDTFAPIAMANPDKPQIIDSFAETIKSIPPKQVLTVLCSILQSDHRSEIAKIEKPTLILQPKEDQFVPFEVALFLKEHIKNSQLVLVNATGHLPHISAPNEVIKAIREFIASTSENN